MSGVIGKGNRSYIKQATGDSLLPDFNVTSLLWVHEITAAEVAGRAVGTTFRIDFSALNFPTSNELRQNGLTNPTSTRILALGIGNHRTNLSIKTSLKRELIDFLSYEADDTGITLDADVSIVAGESWIFTFDQNVQTGNRVVNARPLRKSAIVPSTRTRIAIGATIEVAPSILNADGTDSQQIGNIQVFIEGLITFRNPGNLAGDANTSGNYREVFLSDTTDTGIEAATVVNNGTANAIELNEALSGDADVLIISTNLIVDSETNTISTLTNSANTKLAELPTLEAGNANQFLRVNDNGTGYDLTAGTSNLASTVPTAAQQTVIGSGGTASGVGGVTLTRQWICPPDVVAIFLTIVGGGESGLVDFNGASGGGSGAVFQGWIGVTPGQVYGIGLGQGAGTRANGSGGGSSHIGGTSSFSGSATVLINGVASQEIRALGGGTLPNNGVLNREPGDVEISAGLGYSTSPTGGSALSALAGRTPLFNSFNVDNVWRDVRERNVNNGGNNVIAVGGTGGSDAVGGGGGAGYFNAAAGGGGNGGAGGAGGVSIIWYSNTILAASFPITTP